jgi:hypothetical protein
MGKKMNRRKGGIRTGDGYPAVGGDGQGGHIGTADHNTVSDQDVNISPLFQTIYNYVDRHPKLQAGKKQDAKEQLQEIQKALEEIKPDENFIERRFRNLKRMSPAIVEMAFEILRTSSGGVAELIKRIIKKVA